MDNWGEAYSHEVLMGRLMRIVDKNEISDAELSSTFGIEVNGVYKVKKGLNSISTDKLWNMGNRYKVDMNFIFYGPEVSNKLTIEDKFDPDDYIYLYVEHISSLSEEEKLVQLRKALKLLSNC